MHMTLFKSSAFEQNKPSSSQGQAIKENRKPIVLPLISGMPTGSGN
jgi:hypothetical protein